MVIFIEKTPLRIYIGIFQDHFDVTSYIQFTQRFVTPDYVEPSLNLPPIKNLFSYSII